MCCLVFQNAPTRPLPASNIRISPLGLIQKTARLGSGFYFGETSHGLAGKWVYRTDVFNSAAYQQALHSIRSASCQLAACPDTLLEEFPMTIKEQEHEVQYQTDDEKLKGIRPKA